MRMVLSELKEKVDAAIDSALEYGDKPDDITVSVQIEWGHREDPTLWTEDIEIHYDNDCQASGCVILAWLEEMDK